MRSCDNTDSITGYPEDPRETQAELVEWNEGSPWCRALRRILRPEDLKNITDGLHPTI